VFIRVEAQESINGAPKFVQTLLNVQQITSIMLQSDTTHGYIAQVSTTGGGTVLVKLAEHGASSHDVQHAFALLTAGEQLSSR
jgi:hypothetical protein